MTRLPAFTPASGTKSCQRFGLLIGAPGAWPNIPRDYSVIVFLPLDMDCRYDAIIVGAGPAGSCAAILLAQAGWSVAIFEKRRYPCRKVCGECIAAGNLPLFDTLGIG